MSIHCVNWRRSRNVTVKFVAVLLGLAGAGCADDSYRLGGGEAPAGISGKRLGLCSDGADFESVDQMEDNDGTIALINGRSGSWFAFNDKTAGAQQSPPSDAQTFLMTELRPPRSGSHYAAHSRGHGFTDWGAGIGFELRSQLAYDASRYAGITFWARRSPGGTQRIRFVLPDSTTAPRGGRCKEYCDDDFGATLTLGTDWERYSYSWAALTQLYGEPQAPSVNVREVYSIKFQTNPARLQDDPNEPFDFWIDDIALLCHEE